MTTPSYAHRLHQASGIVASNVMMKSYHPDYSEKSSVVGMRFCTIESVNSHRSVAGEIGSLLNAETHQVACPWFNTYLEFPIAPALSHLSGTFDVFKDDHEMLRRADAVYDESVCLARPTTR
jgi:hypothetical protein